MTPAKVIGSFKLGGALWTILLDIDVDDNARFAYDVSACTITLSNSSEGRIYNHQTLEKHFWEAWFRVTTHEVMQYKEIVTTPVYYSYSSFLLQCFQTLSLVNWDGTFCAGGIEYFVSPDSKRCHKENVFGYHYPSEKKILLSVENRCGEALPDDFIWQTFYHELLHAIATETGNFEGELNSERFVNILSFFIHEARTTLNLNLPE